MPQKEKGIRGNIIQDLQDRLIRNEEWKFYEGVHNIKMGFEPRIMACRNTTENLIASEQQILTRWVEYFEERLSTGKFLPLLTRSRQLVHCRMRGAYKFC
jgi:hypothetical protein